MLFNWPIRLLSALQVSSLSQSDSLMFAQHFMDVFTAASQEITCTSDAA